MNLRSLSVNRSRFRARPFNPSYNERAGTLVAARIRESFAVISSTNARWGSAARGAIAWSLGSSVEVLEAALADAGHEVITAINGQQGLERLGEKLPSLILLDFMMPILDAPGMLKKMKEEPYRDIPAIIISSLPESAIKASAEGL
jgi:hypothetical protein